MASVPPLPSHCNSWIVTRRDSGAAVLETWSRDVVSQINGRKYEARTALDYLVSLNQKTQDSN